MSDISTSGFDSVDLKTEKKESTDDKNGVLKVIVAVLCFLLFTECIVYKFVLPAMRYPRITYSGLQKYSADELNEKLAAVNTQNWLHFNSAEAVSVLSSVPGIESVSVIKHFPDTVSVAVTERKAIAMTFLNEDKRSVPVQIDKNGVLFSVNSEKPVSDGSIPIISGLPVEHLTDGMRIPAKYRGLIDQIAKIQNLPQKYFAAVSEICVVPKEYGNYELVLFPASSRTKVLTDRSLSEEALQYMMVVLDVVKSIDPGVSEIDLRYGSVSYRTGADWRKS